MAVRFENFAYSYERKGKSVFVPSDKGREIGYDLKGRIEDAVQFEPYFYHLQPGGHVEALHAHRSSRFFAKVDIERFFYAIGRNRVARAIREAGIQRHQHYARWSCVKNPYGEPSYAIPYGFVQSPIIASLVLAQSRVGSFLFELKNRQTVSVYMDDISISGQDREEMIEDFGKLLVALRLSGFSLNEQKLAAPCESMEIFNCRLENDQTIVLPERVDEFFGSERTAASEDGFMRYCESVAEGNSIVAEVPDEQSTLSV